MKTKVDTFCRILFLLLMITAIDAKSNKAEEYDLIIIGGGASGTTAGIQAARLGVKTLIVEETEWLGGMLTSAGVSAIDGNHRMPSGLWGEFREKLYSYYGGPSAVETGWVSNTLFEPAVGNKLLKEMTGNEKNLTIWYRSTWISGKYAQGFWLTDIKKNGKTVKVKSQLIIDATELGDVMAALGASYKIGMDSRYETGESYAPETSNDIVQDLTYVVTLQDYGIGSDKTIPKPAGYDPEEFRCACDIVDPASFDKPKTDCNRMLTYAKLPNKKIMINWPICGNDIYLNFIEKSKEEREKDIREAKLHSLRFIYFLQTELGYKHLGLTEKEYPTKDRLPMIPYYRESRRLTGLVTFTLNHILNPYGQEDALYRTGITVGDYTIDHHHDKNPEAPKIDFVKIRVPSYNVPLGSLIPKDVDGLLVAEKSISVTNIVNGATRLQPVVLGVGQAAGVLAAVSIKRNKQPAQVDVREVQQLLLDSDVYLMPYIDVTLEDPHFKQIQKIGATGILKGFGVSYKWANQTWLYPDLPVSEFELVSGMRPYYKQFQNDWTASGKYLTVSRFLEIIDKAGAGVTYSQLKKDWDTFRIDRTLDEGLIVDRRILCVLLDSYLKPFEIKINMSGHLLNEI
jgi:hypothetical protein